MPHPPDDARALALQIGPLYRLREDQLPASVFDSILNGLEECRAILSSLGQVDAPVPLVE